MATTTNERSAAHKKSGLEGEYESRICCALESRDNGADAYTTDVLVRHAGRGADWRIAKQAKEIEQLRAQLQSAQDDLKAQRAVNRSYLRQITDLEAENGNLRAGGMAVAV